jgi:outer membrane protein assembly factor BamB
MRPRAAWLACLAGFLLLTCKGGFPPFVGIETRATTTVTGTPANFVTRATDPEGDSSAVRLDWGDGEVSDWSDLAAPGEAIVMSHAWSQPRDFLVRAQARDVDGRTSDWVASTTVRVLDSALVRWVKPMRGIEPRCPAVGPDGTIYLTANYGLVAIDREGDSLWVAEVHYLSGAPVLGTDGTVYVRDWLYSRLHAFRSDGSPRWVDSTPSATEPAVGEDGTIYLVSDSSLYALNPDGSRRWVLSDTNDAAWISPVIGPDGTIYFVCHPGMLHAVDPDGTLKWTLDFEDRIEGTLAVGPHGTAYVTDQWRLHAVDSTGSLKWTYEPEYYGVSRPLVGPSGTIYALTYSSVRALRPDSGTPVWEYSATGEYPAAPAINADTVLYFGADEGLLHVLRPDGTRHAIVSSIEGHHSPAAIGMDGTAYIAVEHEYLYALKGAAPLASGCWPKMFCSPGNTGCAAR